MKDPKDLSWTLFSTSGLHLEAFSKELVKGSEAPAILEHETSSRVLRRALRNQVSFRQARCRR